MNTENGGLEKTLNKVREQAVREFAENLKARFKGLEYQSETHRKTVSFEFLKETANWILHDVTTAEIDELVNKMFANPEQLKGEENEN